MNRSFHSDDAKATLTRELSEQGLHLPGSVSPGPSARTDSDKTDSDKTPTSARARDKFFIDSPESETRAGRETGKSTTERQLFRELFYAGKLAEARQLAISMCADIESVVWSNNLANVAREQGNLSEAFSIYLTNSHLLTSSIDHLDAAKFYNAFGVCSQELGILHGMSEYFDRAEWAYSKAIKHYELAGKPESVAYVLENTGYLLVAKGQPERSHDYLDRAERLFTEPGRLAGVFIVRALAYEAQNDLANALECLSDAINLLDPIKDVEAKSYDEARIVLRRIGEKL